MAAPPARATIRVAVQSSRRLLRDALSTCLAVRPDVTVVGKVAEADAIFDLCELRRPDVVIVDAGQRLGEIAGRVSALTRRFPELNVIATYRDATEQDLAAACRAGVESLVPESHGLAAVVALLQRKRGRHAKDTRGGLTDRELELVVLTGSGHSVAEIASLLKISPLTVENLKRRVYAKLDVSSSVHAVAKAASLGILDQRNASDARRRRPADEDSVVLSVVCGQRRSALTRVVTALLASQLPFVLVHEPGPVADAHWARWHRGPIVAVLVDPAPPAWNLVAELGVPAILVHSRPLEPPELAEALSCGASSLVPADRIDDHFLSVLRMVGQGYLVVDSMPMRPLIGAVRARWDERGPGRLELPELTARESDILRSLSLGHSIRQTARVLGIAPKTVENVQTRLFRKLGVRNRPGALAVADAFGLLPGARSAPPGAPQGVPVP
jgi:DNA-binding NarL/FixJ family response regulator